MLFVAIVGTVLFTGCSHNRKSNGTVKVLPATKINWEKLNPARGDKSPQAGTLWGDRKGEQATGFLAKFVDGFSSPPHIHNVSYKAIVIKGEIHNDDPKAQAMWMPKTSYWTQPAGEVHITSAKGKTNIALVEIDRGPYLVKSKDNSFDSGERPYNIHSSNIIWRDQGNHQVVDLWRKKSGKVTGSLIKFAKRIQMTFTDSKLVLIEGALSTEGKTLTPGSLISVEGATTVDIFCKSAHCVLYSNSGK